MPTTRFEAPLGKVDRGPSAWWIEVSKFTREFGVSQSTIWRAFGRETWQFTARRTPGPGAILFLDTVSRPALVGAMPTGFCGSRFAAAAEWRSLFVPESDSRTLGRGNRGSQSTSGFRLSVVGLSSLANGLLGPAA